jgi:hypothetical protein
MAFLGALLEKLSRPPEDIRAENLRRWVSTLEGATPISEVEARKRYKVAGVVQNIRIDPRPGRDSIEATIIDGTKDMIVKWLGRQELSGIRLGVGLIVEGIVGCDPDGELMVLNPEYDLVPGPEHG